MRSIVTLSLLILSSYPLLAQDTTRFKGATIRQSIEAKKLDTNEVVYDEQGNALRFYQYTRLLNSGDYTFGMTITPNDPIPKRKLIKLTPEKKLAMAEILKGKMEINSPYLKVGMTFDTKPLLANFKKEELANKILLLIFWNVDCPPCTESFADINTLLKESGHEQEILAIGITYNSKDVAMEKLKQKPLNAVLVSDAREALASYRMNSYPAYVLVNREGIIKYATSGSGLFTFPNLKSTLKEIVQP